MLYSQILLLILINENNGSNIIFIVFKKGTLLYVLENQEKGCYSCMHGGHWYVILAFVDRNHFFKFSFTACLCGIGSWFSQGFYYLDKSLWPKARWEGKGLFQLTVKHHGPSLKEGRAGTQTGQKPGGSS